MALARVSPTASSSHFLIHSLLRPFSSSPSSVLRPRVPHQRGFPIAAALSQASPLPSAEGDGAVMEAPPRPSTRCPWKPTCLYYTQGKCTMVGFSFPFSRFIVVWLMGFSVAPCDLRFRRLNDTLHLEKFNHNLSTDLPVNPSAADKVKSQKLDYFLVLDLEGKVEILEFPVVMINAQSMEFVDSFHRFVHPTAMSEQRIREYIEGKYGKFGVDRVWHDTAIPFMEVLQEFEDWIEDHKLWKKEQGGALNSAAFITCGNWDLKTKATGMMTMMRELQMPIVGSHHLGIDDSKNIARVVQHMLADGAVMQITAKRQSATGDVKFLFKNRIR
uniref:Exonuclease domain-containing protein n=1 Tax=Oryza punctata TaxID=4537 RepID=A0A0E0LBG2_ORYPU